MKKHIKSGMFLVIVLSLLVSCNEKIEVITPTLPSYVPISQTISGEAIISEEIIVSEAPSSNSQQISISYPDALPGDPINTDSVAQNYYKTISKTSTGQELINELYALIHPSKCKTAYKAIWDYLPYCDADPNDPESDNIIAFYRGTPGQKSQMNKEHVWPNSRGGGSIEGDPHMVRPTFTKDNSGRGNDFYNESPISYDPNEFGADQYRDISARIILYCAVQEYDKLTLVDKTTDKTISTKTGTMGKLSTLLKWNLEYPVDETEILRNEVLSGARTVKGKSFNFNRNPFIDDRSYACRIWGNTNEETQRVCSSYAK